MKRTELERILSAHGYHFLRWSKDAHGVWVDGNGGLVIVANKHGATLPSRAAHAVLRQLARQAHQKERIA